MLVNNLDIILSYNFGAETMDLTVSEIIFSFELKGEVYERIDYSLYEDIEDIREVIDISTKMSMAQTIWFKNFVLAPDKIITIDGVNYDVVINFKKLKFKLFKGTNIAAYVDMSFTNKLLGVNNPGMIGQTEATT
jgi:hypothetical protein